MKSNMETLKQRGFLNLSETETYIKLTDEQLVDMAETGLACERTAAIRILGHRRPVEDREYLQLLIKRLKEEKALYTRIEISEHLEKSGKKGAEALFQLLGEIGNNQYTEVPPSISKKKSYPLPRDIAARILGKMHKDLFPLLLEQLKVLELEKRRELLDAIGYMAFYNPSVATRENFHVIEEHYLAYQWDDLIVWKTATCCSAFPLEESFLLLHHIQQNADHPTIGLEVRRSLYLLQHGAVPSK